MEEILKEILGVIKEMNGRLASVEEGQREGFRETNDRLGRIEERLEATFTQVAATAEDVTAIKTSLNERFEAQRNMIVRVEEDVELLKLKLQN